MSMLNITKVPDTGEQCWGVVLLDDKSAALLRSEKGLRKGEITSIAKALKFEGPGLRSWWRAQEAGRTGMGAREDRSGLARAVYARGKHSIRPNPQAGGGSGSPKAAEEAVKVVKYCLAHADNSVGSARS